MNSTIPHLIRLFYLNQEGAQYVDNPNLEKVMDVLISMDGIEADSLSVQLSNCDSMDIGGGDRGMYKCHARTRNRFFDLLMPTVPKDMLDTIDIQMNDEISSFPRCTIVSLDMIKTELECFCDKGELSVSLEWDSTLIYEPL